MAIRKVWVEEGCISCSLSVETCHEVFEMKDDGVRVKDGITDFTPYEERIREAAEGCPVQVIKFEEA